MARRGSKRRVPLLGKHAAVDPPAGCYNDHEWFHEHDGAEFALALRRRFEITRRFGLRRRHGATDKCAADHFDVRRGFWVDLAPAHHLYRLGCTNLKRHGERQQPPKDGGLWQKPSTGTHASGTE